MDFCRRRSSIDRTATLLGGAFWLLLGLGAPLAAAGVRTLVVCDDVADPATLDPHLSFDNKADGIMQHVYESFCRLDSDGRILPAIADRWEPLPEGGLRFRLHPGLRFHDGQPCDAAAAKASFERQRRLANSAAMQIASIREVVVESSAVVKVLSEEPPEVLLRKLAVFGMIVPEKAARPLAENPVGTGPYRFAGWEKGRRVVLESNPDYSRGPKPYFDRLVFEFIPTDRQIDALIRGQVDLVAEVPGTRTLEVARTPGLRIVKQKTLTTHTYWFCSLRGPFADPQVRRAFNLAVNREELIRYAALGNGIPLATHSMEGEIGHNSDLKPYPYDPALAKKLLEKFGWPKEAVVKMFSTQQSGREAQVLKSSLEKIGVKVELTVKPIAQVSRIIAEGRVRSYDIFANQAPDPLAHMGFLASVCFHSRSPLSAGGVPGFDERYDEMMRTRDPQEHERLARQLDAWIYDQALGLFTYQRIRTYGMRQDLEFKPHFTGMLMNLDRAFLKDDEGDRP